MIEIQVHPSDIRKKVKFYFISQKKLKIIGFFSILIILFFSMSIIIAPTSYVKEINKANYRYEKKLNRQYKNDIKKLISFYKNFEERIKKLRSEYEHIFSIFGIPFTQKGFGGTQIKEVPKNTEPEILVEIYNERVISLINVSEKLFEELKAYEEKYKSISLYTPSLCPLPFGTYLITSLFGERINPFTNKLEFHQGIDFSCPEGTPVFATAYGTVTYSGRYPLSLNLNWWRYGNIVVINHDEIYITIYAHLSKAFVRKGEKVKRGQKIAETGNTGWSTRPHLHYEVRIYSEKDDFICVDPRIYILDLEWKNIDEILKKAKNPPIANFEPLPNPFKK